MCSVQYMYVRGGGWGTYQVPGSSFDVSKKCADFGVL